MKAVKGIDYIKTLSAEQLAKIMIRSCPSDVGLKNISECPDIRCVLCWMYALESEIDECIDEYLKQEY